jgi:hypothetical protein
MFDSEELEVREELTDSILDRCTAEGPSMPSLKATACHRGMALVVFDGLSLVEPIESC